MMKLIARSAALVAVLPTMGSCADAHQGIQTAQSCPARIAARPRPDGDGTIIRLLPQAEAMTLLSNTEKLVGRPVDSVYVNNIRAIVRKQDGALKTVLLPYDMKADVGDRIAFQTGYLSPKPLCSYVPALATAKLSSGGTPS